MTRQSKLFVNHMSRVVFDTVIFVRALLDPHSFSGRLIFKYFKHYRLFLSPSLVEEILEVLGRQEIISRFHLREVDYPKALARLLKAMARAEIIEIDEITAVSRDPKDDKFLATAKAANADYLITEDEDLLVLKVYAGVKIINTATFLDIIKTKP